MTQDVGTILENEGKPEKAPGGRSCAEPPPKPSAPSKAGVVPVRRGMTVAEAFEAIVASCLRHFQRNEPLVTADRNTEAVHQCRLAVRRLRSALTLFRKATCGERHEHFRRELRWLGAVLGEARNLDVFLQREPPAAVRKLLEQRRDAAYRIAIATLDSRRARELMFDLAEWAAAGSWRDREIAKKGFKRFAVRQIDRRWRKISRTRHLVSMADERRHRLRLSVKKLRYSLDFIAGLRPHVSRRQKRFEAQLAKLQDRLGEVNDMIQARQFAASHAGLWTIEPLDRDEIRKPLTKASRSLRRMRKIGSYWSGRA